MTYPGNRTLKQYLAYLLARCLPHVECECAIRTNGKEIYWPALDYPENHECTGHCLAPLIRKTLKEVREEL